MSHLTISARSVAALLPDPPTDRPAYQGLADGLRRLVVDGRVLRDTRLPSERELAGALGCSRTTVAAAYALLRDQGYLVSRRGSGSRAALPGGRAGGLLGAAGGGEGALDLTCAAPAAAPGTAQAYEAALAQLPAHLAGSGYDPAGLPAARAAVAARFTARGLPTTPEQILVTNGTLGALALVTRAFLGPGDRMLMESPTYPNAIATARRAGVRPVGLPLEPAGPSGGAAGDGGWDPAAVDLALRQSAPRAAYLIPDYHNPTGLLMSEPVRAEVGAALRRHRTLVVVDETVAELALDPPATEVRPLAAYVPGALTIGGVSKLFWGGLRIGWLRTPLEHVERLVEARLTLDLGAPVLEQLVLVQLLEELDRVRPARTADLRAARDELATELTKSLPQWRFRRPAGGLSLWCELPQPRGTAVVAAAEAEGLLLAPGGLFGVDGGLESFLRLPYTLPVADLHEAVRRLARAWERAADGPAGPVRRRLVA